jgi:hypothetical protein
MMNLDVEGYGTKALMTNDWNNSLCVPDMIIAENNLLSLKSGFPLPNVTLTKFGYKKWIRKFSFN